MAIFKQPPQPLKIMHLSTLLNSQLSNSVGDLNAKLAGALDNELSGLGRNVVGDLSAVLSVVHQEHLKLLGVVNKELVETVGEKVSGVLVGAIADRRLGDGAFESPSHSGVNTLALSPSSVTNTLEALVLVALEALSPLLHDLRLVHGNQLSHCKIQTRLCCKV